jgi:hypothetical protein
MRKRKTSTHGSVAQRKPPKMPRLNQGEAPQAGPSSMPRDSRIDMNRKHVYTGRESSSALDISNARLSSTQPIVIPKALSRPSLSQAISSAKTRVKRKKNGKEKQNNSRLSSSSPDLPENISADFERMKKYQVDKSSVDSVNAPAGEKGKRRPTYRALYIVIWST